MTAVIIGGSSELNNFELIVHVNWYWYFNSA